MGRVQISPSILSADFARLGDEIALVSGTADWAHVDVMDGHFVPNLTLGLPVVEALVKSSAIPIDTHLMIENPDRWAPAYAEAGARSVTFHAEAAQAPVRLGREPPGPRGPAAAPRGPGRARPAPGEPDRALPRPARRVRHDPDRDRRARVRRAGLPGGV